MLSRFERFSYAIFEISRCWHKITADEMARYGLKGPHAIYLVAMHNHGEGLTAAKLGELCRRDKSDVSRTISVIEQKGLVKKDCVNKNLYRALIKLTDKGRLAAENIQKRAALAVRLAGDELDDERRAIFYETLELIASKLQIISKEGLPGQ